MKSKENEINKVVDPFLSQITISLLWTILLFITQCCFYLYYMEANPLISVTKSKKILQMIINVLIFFGIAELICFFVLNKKNVIKINAIYTFIITIFLTVGTTFLAAMLTGLPLSYLFHQLITVNHLNHIPFYTFFSILFIGLCSIFLLFIPAKYFGKYQKIKRRNLLLLIYFFIITCLVFFL